MSDLASAERLTQALRRANVLADERVVRVDADHFPEKASSDVARLRLEYDRVPAGAPASLIFKTGAPDVSGAAWSVGRQEVAFYRDVAPQMPERIAPRCFDAASNDADGSWHLVLEDLEPSHALPPLLPVPPHMAQCEAIVSALARLHARWWNARPPEKASEARLHLRMESIVRLRERLGDVLSPQRHEMLAEIARAIPAIDVERASGDVTVIHGDAHVWNCFLPAAAPYDDARFIDWGGWEIGTATDDLACMIALCWYPERRRRFERRLLDRYHATLLASGVLDYDRRALDIDYRRSVLWLAATPAWKASDDRIPPVAWWTSLECVLSAVEDLGCRELLAS